MIKCGYKLQKGDYPISTSPKCQCAAE